MTHTQALLARAFAANMAKLPDPLHHKLEVMRGRQ